MSLSHLQNIYEMLFMNEYTYNDHLNQLDILCIKTHIEDLNL